MKNLTKRILSIVLCCLLICSVPVISSAETSDFSIGDKITLGNYNNEPITWVCVLIDDNGPLFLSEKILCKKEYDAAGESAKYHTDGWGYIRKQYGSSCWEDSNIRQWLNTRGKVEYTHCSPSYAEEDGFLSSFTESELDTIKEVTHQINVNIWESTRTGYCDGGSADNVNPFSGTIDYDKFYHKNVTDKVMLLDYIQTNKIWNSNKEYLSADENYFLGSVTGNNFACYEHVNITSGNGRTFFTVSNPCGIRPAIYIDATKKVNDGLVKGSYIGYLALGYSSKKLSNAQKILTDQGYNAANMDLNEGTGGRYVCCGWMNVSNSEQAIRDIRVYVGTTNEREPDTFLLNGCTYEKVGADSTSICYPGKNGDGAIDLNFKAGGDYLCLYATRDPKAGAPIRQIDFSFEPVKTEWNTVEYHNTDMPELADFNKGTGGDAVYMHYYSTDPKSGYGTPDWYNFDRDSFNFFNYGTEIDKEYFYNMFGKARGYCLWTQKHYQSGVCFGMAYTTAAILNGYPKSSSMRTDFSSTESPIKIGLKEMTINDYIKYAHIYQFGWTFALCSTWSDAKTIRSIVEKTLKNNNIGVTIGFSRTDNGEAHRVLAVGIGGNGDILIDDPNDTYGFERLQIDENGDWTYTGLPGWNKNNCKLRYSSDCIMPYNYLMMSIGLDFSNVLTASESQTDDNKLLLTVEDENCSINTSDIIEIISENGNGDNSENSKQYWLMSDKSVTVKNLNQEKNEFSLADENYVLSAEVSDNSTVSIELDYKKAETKIASVSGNKYTVSSIQFDEKNRPVELKISGTASGNTVTAVKTENSMTVNGLNDIKVIYLVDETEVSDKKADVKDGREVNITVDDKNETVDTDFVPDSAKCKFCGKVHGDSFIELFVKFFHKIFYLISKLFK